MLTHNRTPSEIALNEYEMVSRGTKMKAMGHGVPPATNTHTHTHTHTHTSLPGGQAAQVGRASCMQLKLLLA